MDTHTDALRAFDTRPINGQRDLQDFWEALMGPLGFGVRRLWLLFVGPDRMISRQVAQIDEVPMITDPERCRDLAELCAEAGPPGGSVAILFTRPGRSPMNGHDRTLARDLTRAFGRVDYGSWPMHFANDVELRVFAPDDLAAVG